MIGRFQVRPPTRSRASSTTTECPAAAIVRAAVSPARPAPTTTKSAFFGAEELGSAAEASASRARATEGNAAAAAAAAPVPISVRRVKPLLSACSGAWRPAVSSCDRIPRSHYPECDRINRVQRQPAPTCERSRVLSIWWNLTSGGAAITPGTACMNSAM